MAWSEATVGLQPKMVPSSVSKMNLAEPDLLFSVTTNPAPPLNTTPVGALGTATTRPCFTPLRLYSVDLSVPLSLTHQGEVGVRVNPHGFTKSESVWAARPGTSET